MINTELLQGVSDDRKKEFEQTLRASTTMLDTLHLVLNKRQAAILSEQGRSSDYDSAAWPYKQAYRNGRYAAYQELLALFTFKKD